MTGAATESASTTTIAAYYYKPKARLLLRKLHRSRYTRWIMSRALRSLNIDVKAVRAQHITQCPTVSKDFRSQTPQGLCVHGDIISRAQYVAPHTFDI